ncbi:MAG: hypothetical protein A2W61_08220 [Deltaproteobacteria bacterium RIFCSPLOWO2_01_44_7]|nr:MAG: hypothetical protein A3D22_08710 [Deltaproteobacteria bacterium RIFCSPHIGHO2_02_FULL_44_53]OGQ28049.1 MAG: hypothetical protein A3D98_07420 [Deltaproteobacteria bacterium RIFCSPHIGHO2_12_FULL_44_21]OGQ40026.1 MAG: hypothetical protein A2W61_08220 [Deltaproteobacteria bacterium RIFCSPLOWO2_01_44_7]
MATLLFNQPVLASGMDYAVFAAGLECAGVPATDPMRILVDAYLNPLQPANTSAKRELKRIIEGSVKQHPGPWIKTMARVEGSWFVPQSRRQFSPTPSFFSSIGEPAREFVESRTISFKKQSSSTSVQMAGSSEGNGNQIALEEAWKRLAKFLMATPFRWNASTPNQEAIESIANIADLLSPEDRLKFAEEFRSMLADKEHQVREGVVLILARLFPKLNPRECLPFVMALLARFEVEHFLSNAFKVLCQMVDALQREDCLELLKKLEQDIVKVDVPARTEKIKLLAHVARRLEIKERLHIVEFLETLLKDTQNGDRQTAISVIITIFPDLPPEERLRMARLFEALLKDKEHSIRKAAVTALVHIFSNFPLEERLPWVLAVEELIKNASDIYIAVEALKEMIPHLATKDLLPRALTLVSVIKGTYDNYFHSIQKTLLGIVILLNYEDRLRVVAELSKKFQEKDKRYGEAAGVVLSAMEPLLLKPVENPTS